MRKVWILVPPEHANNPRLDVALHNMGEPVIRLSEVALDKYKERFIAKARRAFWVPAGLEINGER